MEMPFSNLFTEDWLNWVFPFIRAIAMFTLIPFATSPVPLIARILLCFFTAWLISPGISVSADVASGLDTLLTAIGGEVLCGLLMGFAIQVSYQVAQMGGRFISSEMGLMQSNIFNPSTSESEAIIAFPLSQLVTLLMFITGIHYQLLFAFRKSFALSPVGGHLISENAAFHIIQQTGNIFLIGVQMAAPVLAANFIVIFSFSILGRAVPTINVFMLSFPVRIIVGSILLTTIFSLLARYLLGSVENAPERMLQLLPTQ